MNHKPQPQHSEPFHISPRLFDNRRLKRRRCRWLERRQERQQLFMAQMQMRKTDHRGRQRQQLRQVAAHLPADITIDLLSEEEEEEPAAPSLLLNESICILTSEDDEDEEQQPPRRQHFSSSPPPLAPLTLCESVEEVTVSLVPRSATTESCRAAAQLQRNGCRTPSASSSLTTHNGYLEVDVGGGLTASLPDETTVHTVIANRIYELSLSKLREGLASSGMPEYAQDLLPEQLQKLSPALRAKVAPLVLPTPPTPISLKLSSDLSISLISDDDDCESSSQAKTLPVHRPIMAAEAHAAAKLLKQQQPQLSVVQHLQYAVGPGRKAPLALALPVMANSSAQAAATTSSSAAAASATATPRRRKLG